MELWILSLGLMLFVQFSAYIAGLIKLNNNIADVFWGIGFIFIALGTFFFSEVSSSREIIVTLLVVIWGIRLSARIFLKNLGKPEDPRYAAWRERWGKRAPIWSFFKVYMLQGFAMYVVALPLMVVNVFGGGEINFLDYLGIFVWLVGFVFESIADYELDGFKEKEENKGKILKSGLWQYSRHPNYFGESLMWIGIFMIAFSAPYGWLSILSPILITLLLVKVSGVPLTEKYMEGHDGFEDYKNSTNAFFPWFPKNQNDKTYV